MNTPRTILHCIRHGEVENPTGIRYGRLPGYHLSEKGRKQVEADRDFFINRPLTHIYSSPLERAQQSATILGITFPKVPITLDNRLLETKTLAKFEGKSRDLGFYIPDHPTSDGESKEQVINRMEDFFKEKIKTHDGQEIVAIVHGDPLALLYNHLVYNEIIRDRGNYPKYGSIFSFVVEESLVKEVWIREN